MNNDEKPGDEARAAAGEYEAESGHERRQRLRNERIRKWRKETRHPRERDLDDGALAPVLRRLAS